MSAPSGYNPSATMIAPSSGAIHAMSGGFTSSPYPPGTSASMSLLPDAKGPIDIYRGGATHMGGENEEENMAIAAAVATIANEDGSSTTTESTINIPETATGTDAGIGTTIGTNVDAAADADIAVAATIAIIANEEKEEKKEKKETKEEKKETKEDEDKSKELDIFGTIYKVSNPSKKYEQFGWEKLIDSLHLSSIGDNKLQDIKTMIYNKPNCLSQDLLISSNVHCEPIRELINTVIIHALTSGIMDQDTIKQLTMIFSPTATISGLSQTAIQPINLSFKPAETIKELSATPKKANAMTGTNTTGTSTTGTSTATAEAVPGSAALETNKAPDNVLKNLLVKIEPKEGVAPTVSKPIPDPSGNRVSTTGIRNEPTIACYAITSLQYLFSIPEFIEEILQHDTNRKEDPAMDYDTITKESVDEMIKKVTTDKPLSEYSKTGKNQSHVKDALYYIIVTLLNDSMSFSEVAAAATTAATIPYRFKQNEKTLTSIGRAIMYLMTQFILYLNSSSEKADRFRTQQSAADFISFIMEMCEFSRLNQEFDVSTTSQVKQSNGTFVKASTIHELFIVLTATANSTITQMYNTYQQPTAITDYEDTITHTRINTEQKMEVNISKAKYLHITINNTENVPITIETTPTLSNRTYKLIGTILHSGSAIGGHYRYVRMNTQPGKELSNTPSIVYDDGSVIYYNTLTPELINQIQTQSRELLYVFTGDATSAATGAATGAATSTTSKPSMGGRIKRVIRRNKHLRDM